MERPKLLARPRTVTGTRAVRRMRRDGFVPGVLYGKTTSPTPIMVSRRDLAKFLHARGGEHGLLTLRLEADGKGAFEKSVLIKHLQHDPVDGGVIHVDFHAIALTEQIRIKIPILLKGEPVGVKQDGGVLEHFLREIEVECLPTDIPKQIEHEISYLKIGDAIHARELSPPAGVRITTDLESVIASVLAPKVEKVEEVAEAVTEPEVIREKKPEALGQEEEPPEEKKEKKEAKAEKPEAKEEKREKS